MQSVLPAVEAFAREAAEVVGVELVNVQFRRVKGRNASAKELIISICIHREGGTAIRDCEEVSRIVERHLDETDLISGRYLLEVASRGI